MRWTVKHTVITGLALIAAVNAIALGGVAFNRSGDPDSMLQLSERELHVPYEWRGSKENSGISLNLRWRVLPPEKVGTTGGSYYFYRTSPFWLDEAKMVALGFDRAVRDRPLGSESAQGHMDAKELFLALELAGPAYQEALKRAEKYSKTIKDGAERLSEEREKFTRLFVVDAGSDHALLRARFPDRHRYAIVRGRIRPEWQGDAGNYKLAGAISELSVSNINVPFDIRSVFDGAGESYNEDKKPSVRYQVDVSFGQRFEPWITMASRKAP
jgi:hypothetical protein